MVSLLFVSLISVSNKVIKEALSLTLMLLIGFFSTGLILNQLYPFLDSDYSHYKSVGHRGRLTKGFHTTGGLIHIFTPGVRLDPIEDFRLVYELPFFIDVRSYILKKCVVVTTVQHGQFCMSHLFCSCVNNHMKFQAISHRLKILAKRIR